MFVYRLSCSSESQDFDGYGSLIYFLLPFVHCTPSCLCYLSVKQEERRFQFQARCLVNGNSLNFEQAFLVTVRNKKRVGYTYELTVKFKGKLESLVWDFFFFFFLLRRENDRVQPAKC